MKRWAHNNHYFADHTTLEPPRNKGYSGFGPAHYWLMLLLDV